MTFFVDHYSRVDLPSVARVAIAPTASLRRGDRKGDITALVKAGWKAPEVFVAKGRDGTTDIWGLVWKPTRLRSVEEVSGDRIHLRRPARHAHAEVVRRRERHAGPGRARLHRRADGRHGHVEPLEGVSRRGVAEHQGRRLPRSHPLAPGVRREEPVVRHHARRHLRRIGGRPEFDGRAALPSRVLQGRGLLRRLPRQPHGQDLVERAVDGLADRSAVLGVVERRPRATSCRASCC